MQRKYIIVGHYSEPGYAGRMRFSRTELFHIGVSMLVLTFAFAFFFSHGILNVASQGYAYTYTFAVFLFIAAVGVSTEFLLHELAHKFMAQRYGCWSEYRFTEPGLLISIISGLFGFLFVAPGAVQQYGNPTPKQDGKISAAGPIVNIALGAAFTGLALLTPSSSFFWQMFFLVGLINVWVGGFNMIPIPPLDGSEIPKWSISIYVLMWVAVIFLGYVLLAIVAPGWLFHI